MQLALIATLGGAAAALATGITASAVIRDPLAFLGGGWVVAGAWPLTLAGIVAFAMTVQTGKVQVFGLLGMKPMHLVLVMIGLSIFTAMARRVATAAGCRGWRTRRCCTPSAG